MAPMSTARASAAVRAAPPCGGPNSTPRSQERLRTANDGPDQCRSRAFTSWPSTRLLLHNSAYVVNKTSRMSTRAAITAGFVMTGTTDPTPTAAGPGTERRHVRPLVVQNPAQSLSYRSR